MREGCATVAMLPVLRCFPVGGPSPRVYRFPTILQVKGE
jgi:hypothetical protein